VRSGKWSTIRSGHSLIYMGGDLVLDHVPATGAYRLFLAEWDKPDFLPGPPLVKGAWVTIRDKVVDGALQQHRLTYLGGNHVLDWVPQNRSFRIWKLDRRFTRDDPLLGVRTFPGDGSTVEIPLSEGVFPDSAVDADTQIVPISAKEILIFHPATGQFGVFNYDRTLLSPQPFTLTPRAGVWTNLRQGHVLVWLGELGEGQLLDWESATGKFRLFPDIPLDA
jgi:hypothetical protein